MQLDLDHRQTWLKHSHGSQAFSVCLQGCLEMLELFVETLLVTGTTQKVVLKIYLQLCFLTLACWNLTICARLLSQFSERSHAESLIYLLACVLVRVVQITQSLVKTSPMVTRHRWVLFLYNLVQDELCSHSLEQRVLVALPVSSYHFDSGCLWNVVRPHHLVHTVEIPYMLVLRLLGSRIRFLHFLFLRMV